MSDPLNVELEHLRDFYDAWIGYHLSQPADRASHVERLMGMHNMLQAHYEEKPALYLPERLNG